MFDILNFRILDLIDLFAVAFLFFTIYQWIKGTTAVNIFLGVGAFFALYKIVEALKMELLSDILGSFTSVGLIALIIVFQQEVRQFLLFIGNTTSDRSKFITNFRKKKKDENLIYLNGIAHCCRKFSKSLTGAIMVFEKNDRLENHLQGGDKMNIEVNAPILESIFYKNSPLHDGAVIIKKDKIIATRIILPVSHNNEISKSLGLRHRAAFGICEQTDALCLVISEETGTISLIHKDNLIYANPEELEELLTKYLK